MLMTRWRGDGRPVRRGEAIPIGEIFTFLSGLYFRGKIAYARQFANPPRGLAGSYVITTNCGLIPPATTMTMAQMQALAKNQIDLTDKHYCRTLRRSAEEIAGKLTKQSEVVLLGSIATGKYVDLLLEVFDDRLLFPVEFVGRGDMSRGGLMLRCAADNTELEYAPGARRDSARFAPSETHAAPLRSFWHSWTPASSSAADGRVFQWRFVSADTRRRVSIGN